MTESASFEGPFERYEPRQIPNYGEAYAKGEELRNYTTRKISDDGLYAIVTTHTEEVVHIPQPPTPEEIASQKKAERIAMAIVGTVAAGFLGVMGWISYKDEQNYRRNTAVDAPSGS